MERWHLVTPRTPGKTRRNQLSLVGIRSAGAAGWLQEQCRTSHRGRAKSLQGSRPFSLSAGIWGYAPQEPLQPSLSCRQAWNHPFPQHTHPWFDPSPHKSHHVITSSHYANQPSPTARPPQTGTWRGTQAVHRWWQSPQTQFFPKKPCLFPKACRRASGKGPWLPGWWLQLIPVRSSQRTCWAVNRCLLSTQDTQIGGNFTPESQLVQIWPGNYHAIGC